METGVRLITAAPLSAVRLSPPAANRTVTRIPDRAMLETVGDSSLAGMVEVTWQGERYAAFAIDLDERCVAAEDESDPR
jgi:hypothetical protein